MNRRISRWGDPGSHITCDGERLDTLAAAYYFGDAYGYVRIIVVNPPITITPVFSANIILTIPLINSQKHHVVEESCQGCINDIKTAGWYRP
ncbi:MAG: tail protein X [Arsenophonus sp. NC-QC1-MAG3]